MSDSSPRHLASTPPLRQRVSAWAGVGLAALLVLVTVVWTGRTSGSGQEAGRRPAAAPPASSSRSTDAAPTTTAGVATTVVQRSGNRPRNLLPNASFESSWEGWRPLGGASVARVTEGTDGSWSLRILAGPSAQGPVGIAVLNATTTRPSGRYHTNAWVRPSAPGATVTIGLREYVDGRPVPGSNTLGWTVERVGWRRFGAIHPTARAGSRLALEIMARDLPPGGYIDVDDVVLHLLQNRS